MFLSFKIYLAFCLGLIIFKANGLEVEGKQNGFNFFRGNNFRSKFYGIKTDSRKSIPESFFDQKLDHFNKSNKVVWKQRYWIDTTFFKNNSPVFLYIGGENEESDLSIDSYLFSNLSESASAMRLVLEHRYYGKSRPTPDMSTENLKYLTLQQALQDLVSFQKFIVSKYNLTKANKWVSFGGSYPGTLSTLLRAKYPELIYASFSSSGPMRYITNFYQYGEVLTKALNAYNPKCPKEIKKAFKMIENNLNTKKGQKFIMQYLVTCYFLDKKYDRLQLLTDLYNNIASKLQYDFNSTNAKSICDKMLSSEMSFNPLQRLNRVVNQDFSQCAGSSYDGLLRYYNETSWESVNNGNRQWMYQICNIFGFFASTQSKKTAFGSILNEKYSLMFCHDLFGKNFTPEKIKARIKRNNLFLEGINFKVKRMFFTNGEFDPWSPVGFYNPKKFSEVVSILIKGATHCQDMVFYGDPETIKAQSKAYDVIVNRWLHQN